MGGWPTPRAQIDHLRDAGFKDLKVVAGFADKKYEYNAGYAGSSSDVRAVVLHDTGTGIPRKRMRDEQSLQWILSGIKSSRGIVRACHAHLSLSARLTLVYGWRTWHVGAGDAMFGVAANGLNRYSLGLEIESQGGGVRDLSLEQIEAAALWGAVMLDLCNLPLSRLIEHQTYAGRVQGKVDTAYELTKWRGLVATDLARLGKPAPTVQKPKPTLPPSIPVNPPGWVTIRSGAKGAGVKRVQQALAARGFRPGAADGVFGPKTKAAVMNFQRSQRISVDGVVGPVTARRLGLA